MSDDSFIREVNEEIRQERARALWGRYGPILIGLAVLLVLVTGIYQAFNYWQTNKAAAIGDNMINALTLADQGDFDQALVALDAVSKDNFGAYPALAHLRMAAIKDAQNEKAQALAIYDEVARDNNTPDILKKIANLRAGLILVDSASVDEVSARVGAMASDIDPFRMLAREILGLAEWKAGRINEAQQYFQKIVDENLPSMATSIRAQMMLNLIKSGSAEE